MLLYSRWCALPLVIRNQIAEAFNISKRGATEVVSNEIKSDGYLIEDIENNLTVDSIQDFLGVASSDDTLESLWNRLVDYVQEKGPIRAVPKKETAPMSVPVAELKKEEATTFKKERKTRIAKPKVAKPKATKKNAKTKK